LDRHVFGKDTFEVDDPGWNQTDFSKRVPMNHIPRFRFDHTGLNALGSTRLGQLDGSFPRHPQPSPRA